MRSLLLSTILLFTPALGFAQTAPETQVPDELKATLIQIQENTTLTSAKSNKTVADAFSKDTLPQFVVVVDGRVVTRKQAVPIVRAKKNPPQSVTLRDRTFVRYGDTVVVYALMDRVEKEKGKLVEIKGSEFMDVFVKTPQGWKFLTNYTTDATATKKPVN